MDTNDFNVVIKNSNGESIKCTVIARWHDDNDYIAYIDGTKTGEEYNLYVNRYCELDGEIKLLPITDDEWTKINDFLDNYLYEE